MKFTKIGFFVLLLSVFAFGGMVATQTHAMVQTTSPICDYTPPPTGCNYVQGPNYNPTTHCGMVLSCPVPAPTITSVSPVQFTSSTVVTINGSNLTGATQLAFYNSNGQFTGSISTGSNNGIIVASDGNSLQFTGGLFAANVAPGVLQVKVITPAGTSNALSITLVASSSAAPTVTSISPNSAKVGDTVTVYGSNFDQNTFLYFDINTAATITPTVVSSSALGFVVPQLALGNHGLYVNEKASSFSAGVPAMFTVIAPPQAPTITSISPNSGKVGDTMNVTGLNFNGGNTYLVIDGGVVYPTTTFISGTSMSFVVPAITIGTHALAVSEKGGSFGLSAPVAFSVIAATTPQAPTISYITPTSAAVGATVYVYGTNYDQNTFVAIDGASGQSVTPTLIASDSTSKSALSFVVPALAAGTHTVAVNEKGGSFPLSNSVALTISSSAPTPLSIAVTSLGGGSSFAAGSNMNITWNKVGDIPSDSYYFVYLKTSRGQVLGGTGSGTYYPLIFRGATLGYPTFTIALPTDKVADGKGASPITPGIYYLEVDVANSNGTPIAFATSDAFTVTVVTGLSKITVVSPNGGEQIAVAGKDVDFRTTWTSAYLSGYVTVYLNDVSGGTCLLGRVPVSQGNFPVSLGTSYRCSNITKTITTGQYKIFLATDTYPTGSGDVGVHDSSDDYFTITIPSTSGPTISGVSGPQTLNVGQQGTWAVKASSPAGGNLSYSVVWGDEVALAAQATASLVPVAQQTATFTHSYAQAGAYTPVFTVTADNGQNAKTSLGVNVGGATTITTTSLPSDVDTQKAQGSCLDLQNNLRYRTRDASVNNEVSSFQDFLQTNGFLSSEPTGYFGLMTFKAAKDFQIKNGISPTGFIGSLTRTKIKAMTCSL